MVDRLKKYVRTLTKNAIPQLSVNCVIFGFHDKTLHIVVNKISVGDTTLCFLPGGYVEQNEDIEAAVERVVRESTGLEKISYKPFDVFGQASRSFAKEFSRFKVPSNRQDKHTLEWISQRFVSICYLALVDFSSIQLNPTQFLEAAHWLPIAKRKTLAMDHSDIVKSAAESLMKQLPYEPIAASLLPSRFTLPELQALVEAILHREVDRANFRRKILKTGMIVKVGQDKTNKRRPADVYAFKHGRRTTLIDELRLGF
jgi:8-oxo-dGTP diphosphatase